MYVVICGVLWFIQQVTFHNTFHYPPVILNIMRGELLLFMFRRLSEISQYTIKAQEIGKIIHLVSNEFNSFDIKGYALFALLITPFGIGGVLTLLFMRLGWPAFIILAVFVGFLPLQVGVAQMNTSLIEKINVQKDKRVKVCSEII